MIWLPFTENPTYHMLGIISLILKTLPVAVIITWSAKAQTSEWCEVIALPGFPCAVFIYTGHEVTSGEKLTPGQHRHIGDVSDSLRSWCWQTPAVKGDDKEHSQEEKNTVPQWNWVINSSKDQKKEVNRSRGRLLLPISVLMETLGEALSRESRTIDVN